MIPTFIRYAIVVGDDINQHTISYERKHAEGWLKAAKKNAEQLTPGKVVRVCKIAVFELETQPEES